MKIYHFIVRIKDTIIVTTAESSEDALAAARAQLKDEKKPYQLDLVGMADANQFTQSLKLSTMLVAPAPEVTSLDAMAEMLKNNGYKVEKI